MSRDRTQQPADERRGRQQRARSCRAPAAGAWRPGSAQRPGRQTRLRARRCPSVLTIAAGTSSGLCSAASETKYAPSAKSAVDRARGLQASRVLPTPPGPGEGEQPHPVDAEAVRDRLHVVRAADRPVGRRRQPVRPARSVRQRGQSREVRRQIADDELEEVLGVIEVLEPVLPEIPQRDAGRQLVGDQCARGARDQHLPAVPGRADPRRAVHVQAHVIVLPDLSLAGVDTHPHAHLDALGPRLGGERPLRAHHRGDRVARPREGDEERVTLRVDLAAVVLVERRPQQPLMLAEHLGVAAAQARQQPRRSLDVGEQKGDGATRKLLDTSSYAQSRPHVKSCHATDAPRAQVISAVGVRHHPRAPREMERHV